MLTLAAASGCVATDSYMSGSPGMMYGPPPALNAVGPYGEPMTMAQGPAAMAPESMSAAAANGILPASFMPGGPIAPPAAGVPGGMGMGCDMGGGMGGGAGGGAGQNGQGLMRSQVRFVGPAGAKIGWYVATGGEMGATMQSHQLDLPGRFNFLQASIYRLKLSNINGRPGLELYPTIEVVPSNVRTDAFLAHNYIPVDFTEEDLDQVTQGNFITKVIYLPDPQFQTVGTGGAEELSSTRLDPGVDPIAEAHRRGHILLIVRVGGIDLEARNTPGMMDPGLSAAPVAPPVVPMPAPGSVKPASMTGERGILNEMKGPASQASYPQTAIPAPADLEVVVPKRTRKPLLGN